MVTPFLVCYFIAYLIGAFVAFSWSPAEWNEHLRIFMAIVGNVYGGAMYLRLEVEKL
jgi:hypothetical protein